MVNDGFALRCLSIVTAGVLASLSLVSCGGGGVDTGGNIPITTSFLRVVNTLTDSPTLVAGLDGTALTRVSYAQATGLQQLVAGKKALDVQYVDAAGQAVALIDNEQIDLGVDDQTTVFLVGTLSSKRTKTVVNRVPDIASGNAEVQVMQAAANAGTLDVYLTNIDAATDLKVPSLAPEQASDLATVAADAGGTNYRLRVERPGNPQVLYDSGEFSIAGGTRVMFVVVEYFGPSVANGPGAEGFRVVQLSAQNATNFANEVLPGAFRIANMDPGHAAIDVYIGPVDGTPDFDNVTFASVSALQQFAAGPLECNVTAATPAGGMTVLYTGTVGLTPGDTRTLVVTGSGTNIAARATVDLTRPIAGEGQLQIVNAAPTAASIDTYLIKSGATIADTLASVTNQPPLAFAGIRASPGIFDVAFTPVSSRVPLVAPVQLAVVDGGIYTVYAADAAGGQYQIIVTTD